MSNTAILRIVRSGPGLAEETETFTVPYETGASVLDGLIWLRENRDPSLAFRYSCTNANVCKECTMRIDGETAYACTARLKPGAMTLEPLRNKRVIRDLVTDTVPPRNDSRATEKRPPSVPDGPAAFRPCLYPEPAPPLDRLAHAAA